jgi:hypothetical protein
MARVVCFEFISFIELNPVRGPSVNYRLCVVTPQFAILESNRKVTVRCNEILVLHCDIMHISRDNDEEDYENIDDQGECYFEFESAVMGAGVDNSRITRGSGGRMSVGKDPSNTSGKLNFLADHPQNLRKSHSLSKNKNRFPHTNP